MIHGPYNIKKTEGVLGEDQVGFTRGKGTEGCNWDLRVTLERNSDTDEELCVGFIDWQKTCDRAKWTELTQILDRTGIGWCGKMDQQTVQGSDCHSTTGRTADK